MARPSYFGQIAHRSSVALPILKPPRPLFRRWELTQFPTAVADTRRYTQSPDTPSATAFSTQTLALRAPLERDHVVAAQTRTLGGEEHFGREHRAGKDTLQKHAQQLRTAGTPRPPSDAASSAALNRQPQDGPPHSVTMEQPAEARPPRRGPAWKGEGGVTLNPQLPYALPPQVRVEQQAGAQPPRRRTALEGERVTPKAQTRDREPQLIPEQWSAASRLPHRGSVDAGEPKRAPAYPPQATLSPSLPSPAPGPTRTSATPERAAINIGTLDIHISPPAVPQQSLARVAMSTPVRGLSRELTASFGLRQG